MRTGLGSGFKSSTERRELVFKGRDDWFVSLIVPGVPRLCLFVYRYMADRFVSLPAPGVVLTSV